MTNIPYHEPLGGEIKPMACAVCGHVLETHTEEEGDREVFRGWIHTSGSRDDHVVVPVPVTDIQANFRCDFCLADEARWVLPVEPFGMVEGVMNADDWAACDDCAEALRRKDWNKIVYRAFRAHRERDGLVTDKQVFEHLYFTILKPHITGPVRLRVEEEPS